jgi:hypothetical protein
MDEFDRMKSVFHQCLALKVGGLTGNSAGALAFILGDFENDRRV